MPLYFDIIQVVRR